MTALPEKVLAMTWNCLPEKNFDGEQAESIPIVGKNLMRPSLTGVAVPRPQLNAETGSDTSGSPANDSVLRILMVEDNEDDCALICYQLKKCGFKPRVERVFCEEAMRAALEREPWDVVFIDHSVPGFSGNAAIALIRKMAVRIPILCITGTGDPMIIRQILAAGVFACVSKNDLSLLCWSVQRALNDNDEVNP